MTGNINFNNRNHVVNWRLFRPTKVRNKLSKMWRNSSNIQSLTTMQGANRNQLVVNAVNVLFRKLENEGPVQRDYRNFRYDNMHDKFHAHVWRQGQAYVVMWEADQNSRIIRIVDFAMHENFNYSRKKSGKEDRMELAQKEFETNPKYKAYQELFNSRRGRQRR